MTLEPQKKTEVRHRDSPTSPVRELGGKMQRQADVVTETQTRRKMRKEDDPGGRKKQKQREGKEC